MSNPMGLSAGTVVGRDFEVVRHLASGAMGSVYVVHQRSTGKDRAMKVMSLDLAGNERARDRFVLEARVGANIQSDHVVEVVTAGIDELTGAPYLVMEMLVGEELADMAHRLGPMGISTVAEIMRQAGHALAQAHAQGIVHRDIKPENLFIAESRRQGVPFTVKILDFGIAKLVAERTAEGTQPVGTPLFMAPEQTDRRGLISPATDVWPLGLLAFYLLTGKHYWLGAADGITTLLREVVMEPLVPATERAAQLGVAGALPPGFDDWFARCVARDPRTRFPEAGSCIQAFEAIARAAATGVVAWHGLSAGAATLADPIAAAQAAQAGTSIAGPYPGVATGAPALHTGQQTGSPMGHTAGSTGLTASSSMSGAATGPGARSKAPLLVAAGLAVVAVAGTAFYLSRPAQGESGETSAASPPATGAATASAAPAAPTCPEGMVLIEGGNMFMGSTDSDLGDDVRPPHKVKLSSYCLDEREVTAEAFGACVNAGNCLRPPGQVEFAGSTPAMVEKFSTLCNFGVAERAKHPINCVDWSSAKAFCEGEGGRLASGGARLPTEAEWEFAARGSSQRTYPWGDDPPGPARLNACGSECSKWLEAEGLADYGRMFEGDDAFPATAPVGSFPEGASSAGVLDLAGNVWEWTADWYGPYGEAEQEDPKGAPEGTERVARGGGFNGLKPAWAKPAYRWKTDPATRSHGIGFRCAADLK